MNSIDAQNIPQFPEKLPGTFWGITPFFAITVSHNRLRNYHIFRERSKAQGLKLCTVELAFDDQPFELKETDADILIQIRGDHKNVMWQKEAMLNIALQKLPHECDKIAWIDSDIIFGDDDWIQKTSYLLETYKVIQPFSMYIHMGRGKMPENIDMETMELGWLDNQKDFGSVYARHHLLDRTGHTGFVAAARRSIFDTVGFYDRCILGGADIILNNSFYKAGWGINEDGFHSEIIHHLLEYSQSIFDRVQGSVFYSPGIIFHVWHGKLIHRRYGSRKSILQHHHFNPEKDVTKNSVGLLEWSCRKIGMQRKIKKYFFARNEDNSRWTALRYFFFLFSIKDRAAIIRYILPQGLCNHWLYKSFARFVYLYIR